MSYLLPTSIEAALSLLDSTSASEGAPTIVAGATDYYPQLDHATVGSQPAEAILDITGVNELRSIQRDGDLWRIGALATWSDLTSDDLSLAGLPAAFRGLQQAAVQIGSVQIQNVGTVVGNICNASPAADGVPPLLALGAKVELQSVSQTRVVPLHEFILGNRRTVRQPDELVTAILIPNPPIVGENVMVGSFVKLGTRAYLAISIVMVAALADIDEDGIIRSAQIAVGACSEVAQRLPDLEHDLVGVSLSHLGTGFVIGEHHLAPLSPIDDVRATAAYRMSVTPRLIARALASCRTSDQGESQS